MLRPPVPCLPTALFKCGDFVAVLPDNTEDFWLALLLEDVCPPLVDKMSKIIWVEENVKQNQVFYFLDQKDEIPIESIICKLPLTQVAKNRFVLDDKVRATILKAKKEDNNSIDWITSHLNPDSIIWSSHPHIVAPDIITNETNQPDPFLENLPPDYSWEKEFRDAAEMIQNTPALLIIAGAGLGIDSGLPDYRGKQGFWRAYPPLARIGITFDETHSPDWFQKDPQQAWGFYGHRAKLYSSTRPHKGFAAMKQFCDSKDFFVFTSNIDGQFQKAGFDDDKVYECHGSLGFYQCSVPCWEDPGGGRIEEGSIIWRMSEESLPVIDADTLRAVGTAEDGTLPRCPRCGELARPNVSMAGDTQDTFVNIRTKKQRNRLMNWLAAALDSHKPELLFAKKPHPFNWELLGKFKEQKVTQEIKRRRLNHPKKEEKTSKDHYNFFCYNEEKNTNTNTNNTNNTNNLNTNNPNTNTNNPNINTNTNNTKKKWGTYHSYLRTLTMFRKRNGGKVRKNGESMI